MTQRRVLTARTRNKGTPSQGRPSHWAHWVVTSEKYKDAKMVTPYSGAKTRPNGNTVLRKKCAMRLNGNAVLGRRNATSTNGNAVIGRRNAVRLNSTYSREGSP